MEPPSTPPTFLISLLLLLVSTAATTALAAAAANSSVSPPHPISPTTSPKPAPTRSHHISPTTSPAAASTTPSPATSPAISPTASPTPSSSSSSSALDPKQLRALQSLNIPFPKDPCSPKSVVTACDAAKPFRHLTSLLLANCSRDDVALSFTALKSLSTLHSLSFINCPVAPIRFPADLVASLRSFSCVHSLHRLTGVWLSRLQNLTDLTISDVPVNASGLYVILGNMKNLRTITISRANVTGYIPKHWHLNISHIDLSGNQLKGQIPTSITLLENLELLNLSSNALAGEIPSEIGDLISLKNLSLASNSISGSVPQSLSAIPGLVHVDLSSNQLNGTIPKFLTEMKHLKYLNLEKNNFHGIMPFNESFINELVVFKIGDNSNLCYNHTVMSSKVKLGIAPCDKHGLPMSPPPAKGGSSADDSSSSDDYEADSGDSSGKNGHHHGPNKVVLGFAIALSSIVFLIVFLVLLSRCCK